MTAELGAVHGNPRQTTWWASFKTGAATTTAKVGDQGFPNQDTQRIGEHMVLCPHSLRNTAEGGMHLGSSVALYWSRQSSVQAQRNFGVRVGHGVNISGILLTWGNVDPSLWR